MNNYEKEISYLVNLEEYYFQKLLDDFNDFKNYEINEENINKLESYFLDNWSKLEKSNEESRQYILFLNKVKNDTYYKKYYNFFILIGRIISVLDKAGAGKDIFKVYDDNRTVATVFLRQDKQVQYLLEYKKNNKLLSNDLVFNGALSYLNDPLHNTTMLKTEHREYFSYFVLNKEYNEKTFFDDCLEFFIKHEEIFSSIKNEYNIGEIISKFAYSKYLNSWLNLKNYYIFQYPYPKKYYIENDILQNKNKAYLPIFNKGDSIALYNVEDKSISEILIIIDKKNNSEFKVEIKSILRRKLSNKPPLGKSALNLIKDRELINSIFFDYKTNETTEGKILMDKRINPLNQILYGPPGTGKTYNTINKALEIIFQNEEDRVKEYDFKIKDSHGNEVEPIYKTYNEIQNLKENDKRIHLKGLFEYFKDNQRGQIEFVTFHQSYGYEEFVEGIKAKTDEETKEIKYEIEAGIFKKLCQKATDKEVIVDGLKINNDSKIWKISLGGTYEHPIKTKCFKDDEIRIGWNDVQNIGDENYNLLGSNDQSTIKNFIDYMEPGDIVISIYSQNEIDGIGIIESDYSQDDNSEYNKVRKVKWLSKENIINIKELNDNKILVQKTVYPIKRIKPNELLSKINMNEEKEDNANKNYVLIIDEINRGNISKIFGELITLIEPSKRIGEDEEIRLKLPYSGDSEDPFGVPSNLYIIGTMNTADRSIAQIDTALRRRFEFIEMLPNYEVLSKDYEPLSKDIADSIEENDADLKIENKEGTINIRLLLKAINERIEYIYDREHQIGHSYFMPLKKNSSIEKLDEIFRVNIIPLLAEYFYGDWADIKFVLNDDTDFPFIIDKQENDLKYIKPGSYKNRSKIIYNVNSNEFSVKAYINIYELKNKNEQTDNN